MAWFYCALGSAAIWGLSYSVSEKILKGALSPVFYLTFTGFIYFLSGLALCLYRNELKQGVQTLIENPGTLALTMFTSICYVLGALLIYMSISLKNATLANIIEITYPLFTLLFAYVLFRETHLNVYTAFGALLILSGVVLITAKS